MTAHRRQIRSGARLCQDKSKGAWYRAIQHFVAKLHMGVAGVAWATLIAQGISALLSFGFLMRKLKGIETEEFRRFDKALLKNMVKVAIPTIVQQSIVSVGMVLVQSAVNQFGSAFLAGYTAATKIDGIAIVPMVAVGNAVSTYVAQNMGARKPERIGQGYRICLAMAAGIAVGAQYLSIVSLFYFMMGLMNVSNGVLRGAADMGWFLSCSLCNLGVRVGLTYLLAEATHGMVIMWANPAGWAVGLVIAVFRYFQGGWRGKEIIKQ